MADDLELAIGAKDNSGEALKSVSGNLASLQDIVQELASALKSLDKGLERSQKSLSGITSATGTAEKATKELASNTSTAGESFTEATGKVNSFGDSLVNLAAKNGITELTGDVRSLYEGIDAAAEKYRQLLVGKASGEGGGMKYESFDKGWLDQQVAAQDKINAATQTGNQLIAKRRAETAMEAEYNEGLAKQAQDAAKKRAAFNGAAHNLSLNNSKAEAALDQKFLAASADSHRRNHSERVRQENAETALQKAAAQEELDYLKAIAASHARNAQRRTTEDFTDRGLQADAAATARAMDAQTKSVKQTTNAYQGFDSSLANTRYAMHDVSMAAGAVGVALVGGFGVAVKTVADYETAMANIQRTGEMSADQAATLRDEFVQLATEVPMAFNDLGRIGELAGQLNVPSERIVEFTKNVAMFGATTDVTVDAAATAFGRLDALLPDVQGQYAALGSSILKVGINSVATESEIIATTSQIAAAGSAAGMTADQVIGLSASFASLGVAPESARGTVIRVLGQMNAAVSEGGDKLQNFADTAGVSAEAFQNSWGTSDFTDTFIKFLRGVDEEGNGAQLAIKGLGISAARDQNNLLKLSQNTETVVDIMADASTGFNNAGFMTEQFGIKSETLSAKIQLLTNNITNLVAQAGELGGGALGGLLDVVNGLLASATKLADNPVAQWLTTSYAAALLLTGAIALATSGVGRMIASSLALQPIKGTIDQLTAAYYTNLRAVVTNEAGLTKLQTRMAATRLMAGALVTTLKGIAVTGGIVGAVGLAFTAGAAIMDKMKSSADKAKEAFGSFDTVIQASAKDAAEATEKYGSVANAVSTTGSGFKELKVDLDTASTAFSTAKNAADTTALGQHNLKTATEGASGAIQTQTLLIGQHAQQALQNMIMSTEGMSEAMVKLEGMGFNLNSYLEKLTTGDLTGAKQQLEEFGNSAAVAEAALNNAGFQDPVIADAIRKVKESSELAEGTLANLAVQARFTAITGDEAGAGMANAAGAFNEGEEAASSLEIALSMLSDELMGIQSAAQLGNAMAAMIEAFGGGAIAAEIMGGTVVANVDTIQKAVESSITAGAQLGYTAAESVSALFAELQKQGVDTANLLASLGSLGVKSLGGVKLGTISRSMDTLSAPVSSLSNYFGDLANNARKADESTAGAGQSAEKAAEQVKEAAVQVRTLVDYANDLAGVWARAFDIRFGAEEAADAITTSFGDIRDRIDNAKQKVKDFAQQIKELKAVSQQLKSDKAITEYFLGIANSYGDTLRAGELTADLAKINADIADNKKDVTKATKDQKKAEDEASTSLKGNSEQAIKNRAAIRDLVTEYQKKIEKLASAGLSEQELARQTELLRQDFIKQATQLGFNRAELGRYSKSFSDVTAAIKNVPKNVTVKFNGNPALQALNEFKDKAAASLKKFGDNTAAAMTTAGTNAKNNFNTAVQGIGTTIPTQVPASKLDISKAIPTPYGSWGDFMKSMRKAGWPYVKMPGDWNAMAYMGSSMGYANGGFTGRGGKYDYAGEVHKGEFVIPQEGVNQSTGLPKSEWLARNVNNTDPGAGSAGRISSMAAARTPGNGMQRVYVVNHVELGIQSMHAISNMGGGDVVIGNDQIGAAASQSNVRGTQIGSS